MTNHDISDQPIDISDQPIDEAAGISGKKGAGQITLLGQITKVVNKILVTPPQK